MEQSVTSPQLISNLSLSFSSPRRTGYVNLRLPPFSASHSMKSVTRALEKQEQDHNLVANPNPKCFPASKLVEFTTTSVAKVLRLLKLQNIPSRCHTTHPQLNSRCFANANWGDDNILARLRTVSPYSYICLHKLSEATMCLCLGGGQAPLCVRGRWAAPTSRSSCPHLTLLFSDDALFTCVSSRREKASEVYFAKQFAEPRTVTLSFSSRLTALFRQTEVVARGGTDLMTKKHGS